MIDAFFEQHVLDMNFGQKTGETERYQGSIVLAFPTIDP